VTYRLFLSHSTPPEARERLPEIAAAIEAASGGVVRVLYDQEQIAGGDEWRRRIGYLLHACDGAAILLDDAALASDWVRAEAVFLSLRATYDDDFRVVPVSALPVDELTERLKPRDRCPMAPASWSGSRTRSSSCCGRRRAPRCATSRTSSAPTSRTTPRTTTSAAPS
jgi:hypothetical protein